MSEPVPLQDAILDDAALDALVLDVAHAAELIAVLLRPLGRAALGTTRSAGPASLEDAHRALRERSASVQLRYRYRAEEWWDTLMPVATGVRLVRISHTRAVADGG